jgi:hypothetical protein
MNVHCERLDTSPDRILCSRIEEQRTRGLLDQQTEWRTFMLIFSYLQRFNPSSHRSHIVGPSQEPRTGTAPRSLATKTNDEIWTRANPHVRFDEGEGNSAQARYTVLRHSTSALPLNSLHLFISNLQLRNDSVFAEVGEEIFEHILRIDAVVETSAARLDRARDVVTFHETENGVSEGPRRNLFVR